MFLRREGEGAVKASIQIAHIMFRSKNNIKSYKSTCIRVWSKEYLLTGKLPSFRQGLHPKHESIVCDEHVKTRLQVHLRSLKPNKRTPLQLCTDYNAGLLSDLSHAPSSIGLRTAYRWMRYLGFSPDRAKKGYYSDEHNRPDIIAYRDNEFLPKMADYEAKMIEYSGDDMTQAIEPALPEGVQLCVVITHDETTVYCNDGKPIFWMENGRHNIRAKSLGTSAMISGFCCSCHGFMSDEELGLQSYQIFLAGKNREGWFTNDDLVAQLQKIMPLIEKLHPNKQLVFAFDNSMTHHARAPDGLEALRLPLKDNGKNAPLMRNTTYFKDGTTHQQLMQNSLGHQKGIKSILVERGEWKSGMLLTCKPCEEVFEIVISKTTKTQALTLKF
jgi:hypothetical protein